MRFAMTASLGACAHLGAPGPVVADRPGYTDTPVALPAGAVQLEAGVTDDRVGPVRLAHGIRLGRRDAAALGPRRAHRGPPIRKLIWSSHGVRRGERRGGMEDFKLGAKLNLRAAPDSIHSWAPNVALLAATTLPTGAGGIRRRRGPARGQARHELDDAEPILAVHQRRLRRRRQRDGPSDGKGWVSAASWWAINPRVSVFAEGLAIGRVSGSGSGTAGNEVDGGFTFLINDRFQLDVRAGRGLGSETRKRAVRRGGIGKALVRNRRAPTPWCGASVVAGRTGAAHAGNFSKSRRSTSLRRSWMGGRVV